MLFAWLLVVTAQAAAQAPTPVSPPDGHVFTWEDVEIMGVPLAVDAPSGRFDMRAEVSRDPGFTSYGDDIGLFERSPGRYEGTALTDIYEAADAGVYYWRAYYYDYSAGFGRLVGAARSFSIKPRYRRPSLTLAARRRAFVGRSYPVFIRYRPGSESQADRLQLVLTADARCASELADASGRRLLTDAEPSADVDLEAEARYRRLGVFRLCAYVTSNGVVTERAVRRIEVVRAPVPKARMLRWRLSSRGLGPIRVGMRVSDVERITGRSMFKGYGEYASCQLWSLSGAPGLSLMRAYGRIARIEAYRGRWRSNRGVRIGDSEAKVRRRYRGVRAEPHPYVPPGKYLIVGGARRRMIFETNPAGRVTSFRGGRSREVGYIEGCA